MAAVVSTLGEALSLCNHANYITQDEHLFRLINAWLLIPFLPASRTLTTLFGPRVLASDMLAFQSTQSWEPVFSLDLIQIVIIFPFSKGAPVLRKRRNSEGVENVWECCRNAAGEKSRLNLDIQNYDDPAVKGSFDSPYSSDDGP